MLVENKLLKKVKDLGLNSYEAKIWTALLSRGVSTAGEISDIANVPRSRSYDVLESLEKKGFIIMKVGKPIQYISVSPKEVLDRVKQNVQKEANDRVEVLEEFQDSNMLQELVTLHTNGIESVDPTDIAGYVKTTSSITDQMKTLIKNASEKVMISTNEKGLNVIESDLSRYLRKAASNGVKIMISAPTQSSLSKENGIEVSKNKNKGRFMVADNTVLVSITGEEVHPNYDTAIWADSKPFADIMSNVFIQSWQGVQVEANIKAKVTQKVQQ